MKKLSMLLFAFFILLNTLTLNAQICEVIDNPSLPAVPNSSYGDLSKLSLYQPTQVRTVFIAAHIVRSNSGTGGISTNDIATSIQQLNTAYTDVMIQFVHNQTDYIDNDTYYNLTKDEYLTLRTINNVSNKINVYYVPSATDFAGIATILSNNCAVTNAAAIDGSSLAHEIGHDFYLYHTHGTGIQELVNQSNCNSAGDFLCDTPAEPYNAGNGILGYVFTNTCGYFGTFRDANNELFTPDTHNFMGYSVPSCKTHFSPLQIQKINQTITTYFSYLINASVVLSNKINGNIITNVPNVRPSTLTVVGVTTVNSGSSLDLPNGNGYDIKTNQERFPNFPTYGNIKHNNWNSQATQFKLSENYIVEGTFRDANFQSLKYSLIQGRVESVTNAGSFQFQDPWYLKSDGTQPGNYWIPCTATYEPNGKEGAPEKGVFQNQGGTGFTPPYYSVKVDAEQNAILSQTGKSHRFYFQNWSATGANFQNANALETPVVFTSEGATVQANLKGTQLSTDVTAFSNNSQRRLIETLSGGVTWLHQVYTSMGHVWIEHSSNGGSSWIVGNNGQPLDGSAGGKNPSIAYTYDSYMNYNYIGVVWQQPYGSTYKIMGKVFNQYAGSLHIPNPDVVVRELHTEPSDAYSVNANPNVVLCGGVQGPYFITFERKSTSGNWQPGINWLVGHMEDSGTLYDGPFGGVEGNGIVTGTDAGTVNVQMSREIGTSAEVNVNLIRQQGSPGKIYSHYLYLNQPSGMTWQYQQYDDGMISYNSELNSNPLIVTLPNYYYGSCWIEYEQMVYYSLYYQVRYYYGSSVQSCAINRGGGSSNSGFAAWSQNPLAGWSNRSVRFDNGAPAGSSISTLSTSGKYVQAGNGAGSDLSNMYVSSFYPFTSPYYFSTSGTLGPLSKETPAMIEGRGFVINAEEASFSYRLDNLNVDGKNIGFTDAPDNLDFGETEILNSVLVTEAFRVNKDSKIIFSESSGFADSSPVFREKKSKGLKSQKI